jgi:hypothetical protein
MTLLASFRTLSRSVRSFPTTALDEELLAAIDQWVKLLAEERYEDALAFLPARDYWTPDLLSRVIDGYGFPEAHPSGTSFRVTTPTTAAPGSKSRYRQVDRWPEPNLIGTVGVVRYDLPLNGHWSDVTALFDLRPHDDILDLVLDDIHVL